MKLDMLGLTVKDMKRALEFYELIGLNCVFGDENSQYTEVGNESIRISLNSEDMIQELTNASSDKAIVKCELAFLCESKEEVDTQIKKLKAKGVTIIQEPFDAPWGQYYAMVSDYDGHHISFFV